MGQPLPVCKDTIEQFTFEEGSGTTSLGNIGKYTANLIGSPTWSTDTPSGVGNSIVLNGTTQAITVPGLLAGQVKDFTVALWVKPTTAYPLTTGYAEFVNCWNYSGSTLNSGLRLYSTLSTNGGQLHMECTKVSGGAATAQTSGSQAISSGTWHRLVICATAIGFGRVFLDGAKFGEGKFFATDSVGTYDNPCAGVLPAQSVNPFTIGATNIGGTLTNFCNGKFAEVVVESKAWTQAEVTADYLTSTRAAVFSNKIGPDSLYINGGKNAQSIQEPNVLASPFGGYVHTWSVGFTGGEAIYFGTSTDGQNITPSSVVPIVGEGNGSESGSCGRSGIIFDLSNNLHFYYSRSVLSSGQSPKMHVLVNASNGSIIGTANQVVAYNAQAWMASCQNIKIRKDPNISVGTSGAYKMLLCCGANTGAPYRVGLWTSPDLINGGTWTPYASNPLTTLETLTSSLSNSVVGNAGRVSAEWDSTASQWFATVAYTPGQTQSSYLPTVEMLASSPDMINWTYLNDQLPVMTIPADNQLYDQRADGEVLVNTGGVAVYGEVLINAAGYSKGYTAFYPGTWHNLVTDGSGGSPNFIAGTGGGSGSSNSSSAANTPASAGGLGIV